MIRRVLALLLLSGAVQAQAPVRTPGLVDVVVATVERTAITARDLDLYVFERRLTDPLAREVEDEVMRRAMLTRAVDDFLLSEWARTQLEEPGAAVLDTRANLAIEQYQLMCGSNDSLLRLLEAARIDPTVFRAWVRDQTERQLLIREAIAARADTQGTAPEDGGVDSAVSMKIAQIMIRFLPGDAKSREAAMEKAVRLRRDIESGVGFDKAAKLYSDDAGSRERGGVIGWFAPEQLEPLVLAAARSTPFGRTSPPIERGGAIQIIQVIDYETAGQRAYFEAIRREEDKRLRELRTETDIALVPGYELEPLSPAEPDAPREELFWKPIESAAPAEVKPKPAE